MSLRVICTLTRSPAGIGGNAALVGLCAAASSAAFPGTIPAKLDSGNATFGSVAGAAAAADRAAARGSRASAHISSAKTPMTPAIRPSSIVATIQKAPELVFGAGGRCRRAEAEYELTGGSLLRFVLCSAR